MPHLQLFLGIPLEGQLKTAFEGIDPHLLSTFFKDGYLQKTIWNGQVFIGKTLETVSALAQVELSEAHLRSLYQRLLPDYPVDSLSLHLLALPDHAT